MRDLKEKTDAEIVKLSQRDDKYFEVLIERYEKKLSRYISRIASLSRPTTEDLLQDIFIKIYQNLNAFDDDFSFSSWAYRIAHNTVVSYLRSNNVRPKMVSIEDDEFEKNLINFLPSSVDLPKEFDKKDLSLKVRAALDELPDKYKEVLVLYYLEEKSYKEISDILKRPINSVSVMINRAKTKMKESLNFVNQ